MVKVAGLKIEGMYPFIVSTVGNQSVVCLSMVFAAARALEGIPPLGPSLNLITVNASGSTATMEPTHVIPDYTYFPASFCSCS